MREYEVRYLTEDARPAVIVKALYPDDETAIREVSRRRSRWTVELWQNDECIFFSPPTKTK